MKIWRMSFRCGNQGYEMWPHCRELGVAALTYYPLHDVDLSQFPQGEPTQLWKQLSPTQKSSLRRVAFEMRKGDIIYVKQGPEIVGRGIVTRPYHFDIENRIVCPDSNVPWSHQVSVDWESDFELIDILLGAEPITVLELSNDRLQKLESVLTNRAHLRDNDVILPEEIPDTIRLNEGSRRKVSVNIYERNQMARERCIAHYGTDCSICGFNFVNKYGEAGDGFIHVHHLIPLSQVDEEYEVDPIRDLRPICPNCHAIIHRRRPEYTIDEVKKLIEAQGY